MLDSSDPADVARVERPLVRLYGEDGTRRIRSAHVVVVGVGGVGSWVAEALARSSIGRLTLIDMDHVAASNLNRQVHAIGSTLGQAKVLAMAERIRQFQTLTTVQCCDEFVSEGNWPGLIGEARPEVLVDACDDFRAKLKLATWSLNTGSTLISVGAAGGKKRAELVKVSDLSEVTHDPLLAKLRYTLRKSFGAKRQGRIGITCVSSPEGVEPPIQSCASEGEAATRAGTPLACHGYGSSVAVTASFGFVAAGHALNLIGLSSR